MANLGLGPQPLWCVRVNTTEPDRSEFMRDAEAALRLGDPAEAGRFLSALCDRRAWVETYEQHDRTLGAAYLEAAHHSIKQELLRLCYAWGFL